MNVRKLETNQGPLLAHLRSEPAALRSVRLGWWEADVVRPAARSLVHQAGDEQDRRCR